MLGHGLHFSTQYGSRRSPNGPRVPGSLISPSVDYIVPHLLPYLFDRRKRAFAVELDVQRGSKFKEQTLKAQVSAGSWYGRYGYRRIAVLLREAGWNVGKDRVEQVWRREGLKVPRRHRFAEVHPRR